MMTKYTRNRVWAFSAVVSSLIVSPLAHSTAKSVRPPLVPCLTSHFVRVFKPAGTRYLNDHTLIQDAAGLWHLYGITHTSKGDPFAERSFLHATAPSLQAGWTEQQDILDISEEPGARFVWAPHVIQSGPNLYSMYFYEDSAQPRLRRADSNDLMNFRRVGPEGGTAVAVHGGRDAMVFRDHSQTPAIATMLSVGVEGAPVPGYPGDLRRGTIIASAALDPNHLDRWQPTRTILTDPVPSYGWGNLESPFMYKVGDTYFLFVTRTGEGTGPADKYENPGTGSVLTDLNGPGQYLRTLVFRSKDPNHFEWQPIAAFRAHASEVIEDRRQPGRLFLTSSGWTSAVGEARRGLTVAPLEFRPQGYCPRLLP